MEEVLDGSPVTGEPRRARAAVAALFLVNAAVFASVVPRLPEIKDDLGLSNAALGTALAAAPVGALVSVLIASPALVRWGSSAVAVGASLVMAANLLLVGFAPSWALLAGALFITGSADSVGDIANNAHGLRVQRRYGRSILNAFHGLWSVGAVAGGLAGSAAAGLGVPLPAHFAVAAAACVAVVLVARRSLLTGHDDSERATASAAGSAAGAATVVRRAALRRTAVLLLILGLVMALAGAMEDSAAAWGAIYLRDLGAGPAVAGLAFVSLQSTQAVARLLGDRVVTRFGDRAVGRAGGILATAGIGGALLWPSVPATIVGFGLAGLGLATIIPATMHSADEIPGLPAGAALSVAGFIGRLGFLLPPPLIGLIADARGLRTALVLFPVAGVLMIACSGVLRPRANPIAQRQATPANKSSSSPPGPLPGPGSPTTSR